MELTVKEYASRERVTERTVRTWIAKGAVRIRRTPGGGVRIPLRPIVLGGSMVKNAEGCGNRSD